MTEQIHKTKDNLEELLSKIKNLKKVVHIAEIPSLKLNKFDTPEMDIYYINDKNKLDKAVFGYYASHSETGLELVRTEINMQRPLFREPLLNLSMLFSIPIRPGPAYLLMSAGLYYKGIEETNSVIGGILYGSVPSLFMGILAGLITYASWPAMVAERKNNKIAKNKYKSILNYTDNS